MNRTFLISFYKISLVVYGRIGEAALGSWFLAVKYDGEV
jgi:hypothetical protein